MIPRLAALSTAAIAARICSALGLSEERSCLCIVRSRVMTLRLRTDRFKVWRARLAADLVLAMVKLKLRGWTLATQSRLSTPKESAPECTGATVTRAEYFERPPCPCSAPVCPYAPALFVVLQQALPPFAFARR